MWSILSFALVIASTQIRDFLGLTVDVPGEFIGRLEVLAEHLGETSLTSLGLGLASLAAIVFFNRYVKQVPGYIAALFVGTLASVALGLNVETIRAAGIRSCGDVGELASILNRRNVPRTWGPCLVFPYRDESGAVVLNRVRPNNPPIAPKTGKAAKYIQPTGQQVRLYVPPDVFPVLGETARLLITEGELKALAATQAGLGRSAAAAGLDVLDVGEQIVDLRGREFKLRHAGMASENALGKRLSQRVDRVALRQRAEGRRHLFAACAGLADGVA